MPRTASLAKIESQIQKLQQKADAIREKEKAGVVSRIKDAIAHYSLTSADLFGPPAAKKSSTARKGGRKQVAPPAPAAKARHRASPQAGTKVAPKYRDNAGNQWTGRGNQPRWLKAALTEGKTLEEFAIKV